jgi:hypothetical protein
MLQVRFRRKQFYRLFTAQSHSKSLVRLARTGYVARHRAPVPQNKALGLLRTQDDDLCGNGLHAQAVVRCQGYKRTNLPDRCRLYPDSVERVST